MTTPPFHIPGLVPFVCEYVGDDGRIYGITLYASDPDQIERDWPDIEVIGTLIGTVD